MRFVLNSLGEYHEGLEEEWTHPERVPTDVSLHDLATLIYGARNHHDCAVSPEEGEEIMDAVHRMEERIGVGFGLDSYYDTPLVEDGRVVFDDD